MDDGASLPPNSDECLGQTYEKLLNRHVAADYQKVVYMNTSDAQQQQYKKYVRQI